MYSFETRILSKLLNFEAICFSNRNPTRKSWKVKVTNDIFNFSSRNFRQKSNQHQNYPRSVIEFWSEKHLALKILQEFWQELRSSKQMASAYIMVSIKRFFVIFLNCCDSHYLFWYNVIFPFVRYWMQQPHVRKSMKLGSRRMSDGLEIYKAMIEDTMQSIRPELVEAMENYKVKFIHILILRMPKHFAKWPSLVLTLLIKSKKEKLYGNLLFQLRKPEFTIQKNFNRVNAANNIL